MFLPILIIVPLITALAVLLCKGLKQVRAVALAGSVVQLLLAFVLFFLYRQERSSGNSAQWLWEWSYTWFEPLHINFHVGVDGISVAMILLTAFVVVAGVLVSWTMERLNKEFFFLLIFLGMGAYGFFISLDLFTLFFFLEVAVIPKFLLIGIWGSGKKEYSAMKLVLMLMGGSALVFVGLLGIYFNTDIGNGQHSFDLPAIAQAGISPEAQKIFFPFAFIAGAVRGIPLYWRLVDCLFGFAGGLVLLFCYRDIRKLQNCK